jgi:MFS family permease
MWWSDLAQGAVVTVIAVLIATHRIDIWVLAAAGFCLGCAQVVFDNAAQSVLPSLVPPDLLAQANGTQYVVQVIGGQFVGPPIGSALFAVAPVAPFVVDAVSFVGSVALLRGLPRTRRRGEQEQRGGREPRGDTGDGGARAAGNELSAGFRWLAVTG